MPTVETVNGPVDLDELGLTLIHEHFRITDEATRFQFPHLYDEQAEWEAAHRRRQRASRATASRRSSSRARMFLQRDARLQQARGRRERPAT